MSFLHVYRDLDLRSYFEIDRKMPKLAYFDAFDEKHDGVTSFALSLMDSKLFRKTCCDENDPFYI